MQNNTTNISLVIPTYYSSKFIIKTLEQLSATITLLTNVKVEVIIIDDGSNDGTFNILKTFKNKSSLINFHFLKLNKNYGQQKATWQGILKSTYENIITLDDDYLYPFNDIKKMIDLYLLNTNYVIYGVVKKNTSKNKLNQLLTNIWYSLITTFSKFNKPATSIRLFNKKIIENRTINSLFLNIDEELAIANCKPLYTDLSLQDSFREESSYPLFKSIGLVKNILFGYVLPKKKAFYTTVALVIIYIVAAIIYGSIIEWKVLWIPLAISIFFIGIKLIVRYSNYVYSKSTNLIIKEEAHA